MMGNNEETEKKKKEKYCLIIKEIGYGIILRNKKEKKMLKQFPIIKIVPSWKSLVMVQQLTDEMNRKIELNHQDHDSNS